LAGFEKINRGEDFSPMPVLFAFAVPALFLTVADVVPNYDVRPTCKAAMDMMGHQGRTVDNCMDSEKAAHADVAKNWSTVPKEEKTRCVQTALERGSPSYVELLICIEMNHDSRMRQQQLKNEPKLKAQTK
jgi:hypothetical protein